MGRIWLAHNMVLVRESAENRHALSSTQSSEGKRLLGNYCFHIIIGVSPFVVVLLSI